VERRSAGGESAANNPPITIDLRISGQKKNPGFHRYLFEERQIYLLFSDNTRRNLTDCSAGTSLSEQPQPASEGERANLLTGIGEPGRQRHPQTA
jgi:hypothetical protein